MTREVHRRQVIRYWLSKAEEGLESAKREYEAGSFSFAVNRVYYAAFYAVSSLLLEKDYSFKKHSGVRFAFHQKFVKTGLVDIEWGKFYDRLFEDRQESDYIALTEFDKVYVEEQIKKCDEFLSIIKPLITSR